MEPWVPLLCVSVCHCFSVSFLTQNMDVYVAVGRDLVLKAKTEPSPDRIPRLTWERKTKDAMFSLLTFPNPDNHSRYSWEEQGQVLKVPRVEESDFGTYIITVTDQSGAQKSASKTVLKSESSPEVTLSLLCNVSGEREQWDTPVVSWVVDGEEATNLTANLSADGRSLYLSGRRGCNYTCIVNSSLGTSSSTFYISGCGWVDESCSHSHWGIVASGVVVTLMFIISLLCVLRGGRSQSRQVTG